MTTLNPLFPMTQNDFLSQVQTDVKAFVSTQTTIGKLRLVSAVSRILGIFLLAITIVLLSFALLCFVAVAAISAISAVVPLWAAALMVAALYIVLIVIAIVWRKCLFVRPFVRKLNAILAVEGTQETDEPILQEKASLQREKINMDINNGYLSLVQWGLKKLTDWLSRNQ